jgi:CheY-like chemotaxis protein
MRNLDVLVIDDNKTTRDMLRTLLEFEGHNVSCCENGKSGLELMKSKRFEIIVTDYLMPEMNGDEVTKLARRFSPDSFIIGCSVDAKARQFVDAGAHAFLSKDHVVYQLVRLIEQRASLYVSTAAAVPGGVRRGG